MEKLISKSGRTVRAESQTCHQEQRLQRVEGGILARLNTKDFTLTSGESFFGNVIVAGDDGKFCDFNCWQCKAV